MHQEILPELAGAPSVQKAAALDSLRKIFTEKPLSEGSIEVLAVVGLLVFLIAAATTWAQIRKRKKIHLHLGWIRSGRQIRQILDIAIKQHSTFELHFVMEHEQGRPVLRCAPGEITADSIFLEAHGLQNIARKWDGKQVHCYFKINMRDQAIVYAFRTVIREVLHKAEDRSMLILQMPGRMENRQKRAFLRITPPAEYLLGAALWYGGEQTMFRKEAEITLDDIMFKLNPELAAGLSEEELREKTAQRESRKVPSPNLLYIRGRKEQFAVNNISATGARISISRPVLSEAGTEFAVSDELALLLDLLDPEKNKQMRFWLFCRVQNISVDHSSGGVSIGLQFTTWTMQDNKDSTRPDWVKVHPGQEVAPLSNWIVKRHLELFHDNADGDLPF